MLCSVRVECKQAHNCTCTLDKNMHIYTHMHRVRGEHGRIGVCVRDSEMRWVDVGCEVKTVEWSEWVSGWDARQKASSINCMSNIIYICISQSLSHMLNMLNSQVMFIPHRKTCTLKTIFNLCNSWRFCMFTFWIWDFICRWIYSEQWLK